jgi:hypothetical protein
MTSLTVDIELTKKACESALVEPIGVIINIDGVDEVSEFIRSNESSCLGFNVVPKEICGLPVQIILEQEELAVLMVKVKR